MTRAEDNLHHILKEYFDHLDKTFAERLNIDKDNLQHLIEADIHIQSADKLPDASKLNTRTFNLLIRAGFVPFGSTDITLNTLLELTPNQLFNKDGPLYQRPSAPRPGIQDPKPPGYGFGEESIRHIEQAISFHAQNVRT